MTKLQQFYKSQKWEKFVELLRIERTDDNGDLICKHCGKPILKAYDCIAHHVIELTEDNVNDANISLNPENIILIHFKCHNEIHKRFGYNERLRQNVYIVYGAPCSGKSTYVDSIAESGDIILDIDRLWKSVRAKSCNEWAKPNELKSNVFALRDCMLDMIKVRRGKWHNAYVIGGYPFAAERERLADSLCAKLIFIDCPKELCLERAKLKNDQWIQYVEDWFNKYSPR